MSENESITKRAEQILAMLTPEQIAKMERKTGNPARQLAIALAQKERTRGTRTAKPALSKAMIAMSAE